ncbi:MAG: phosphate/phosphite/phosphonate ABC transporter substrate-binding protein [Deltaproteobacteria bacterium]|nr:phosphate/phosphite/phosphonate ABC transporter substrate-binding protein [Deltaproteobacteria bacterium]
MPQGRNSLREPNSGGRLTLFPRAFFGAFYERVALGLLCLGLVCEGSARAERPLVFGVQPQWTRDRTERMFQPLVDYLEEQTGREIRLRVTEDYGALLDELASGAIDLAKIAPYGYVVAKKTLGVRIIASELTMGRPYYHGLIVVRSESDFRSIEDLRGHTFSYTDPNSASGFIYPRAYLVSRGQDPHAYFSRSYFAGSHDACIRGVASGSVDACATWDVALEDETHSALFGVRAEELRVVHKTEPIPNDAYVVRAEVDPAVGEAVKAALLRLSGDSEALGKVIDWKTRIDGFVEGDDSAYEVVRQKVALKDLKRRLAVVPFEVMGSELGVENPGQVTAEMLAAALFDARRFLMTERTQLEKALNEQRLGLEDLVDSSTALRVGHVLGADVVLTGSVMRIDGKLHVTSRLIETETARILSAQHAKGESIDGVVKQVASEIAAEEEVAGFVLKVRNTENVTLDLGALQGVHPGDVLKLYREGEPLVHPVTGKPLGTEEIVLGEVVAVRTTADTSFGKVTGASEVIREGFRVRTLSKGEVVMKRDRAALAEIVQSYEREQQTKYAPWIEKYAWRVAAIGTLPALWALGYGSTNQKLAYGGLSLGLWAITGGVYVYGLAAPDDAPKGVAVGGTF